MELLREAMRFIAGNLLPRIDYPVIRGPLRGTYFKLGALAGEGNGASVYIGEVEPAQTAVVVSLLKPGDIFYDVGANVGYYTMLASRLVGASGKVVAVEPLLRNLNYLFGHCQVNRATNVAIIPAACAERPGLAGFEYGYSPAEGKIVNEPTMRSAVVTSGRMAHVCTTSLDALVNHTGWTPNLIKIDVEGAEDQVLNGAKLLLHGTKPTILLSVHSDALRTSCVRYLAEHGYTAEPIEGPFETCTEFICRP